MNNSRDKWPNLFIVGAPKAGTSSLHAYLSNIPGIYMVGLKEPHYFSIDSVPDNSYLKPIRDKTKYLALFKGVKDKKYFGESSVSYLVDTKAPKLIFKKSPNAKIIISLRDPVERTFSHHLQQVQYMKKELKFYDRIQKEITTVIDKSKTHLWLETGLYFESVKRYLETFGNKQVKILIFENWIKNPKIAIQEILELLELSHSVENFNPEVHNPFRGYRGSISRQVGSSGIIKKIVTRILPKSTIKSLKDDILLSKKTKPKMNHKERDILIKYFREDVDKLQELLGLNLPWPNFQNSQS